MRTMPGRAPSTRRQAPAALRVVVAVAFAVSALVHLDLAERPWFAGGEVTLSGLWLADAVAALLVGGWVLFRPSRAAWAVAVLVATGSLLALLLATYVQVPGPGPLPTVYDPLWFTEKVVAAGAAAVAAAGAAVALATTARRRGAS